MARWEDDGQAEAVPKQAPIMWGDLEVVAHMVPYNGVCASCGRYRLVCRDVLDPQDEAICQECLAYAMGEEKVP